MPKAKVTRKKETKKKKRHPLRVLTSLTMICIAGFLTYLAVQDVITTLNLKKQISTTQSELASLEKQKKELTEQKTNLEDPEYIKKYARGKFLVSKDGEQVLKLPSKDAIKDNELK